VLGLARYSPERLHPLPVTLGHTEHRYSSGFITHNQHQAGLLRLEALLAELGRRNL
jgi:chemotaxis signal transduction protein